ncbi:mandelate racemase/muconate lactonizing enzyme family protein [Aliamphritea spongicola]|uniref:mandelate racemase/muconate lactonizing enzyme family protein n=1 Tax=Aliamphritea spongicola TaxID=707589 RepID=UPI00196AB5CA|nr:mandelate racemase/muconate lactonizing enzyme family protein [Aliamphritea spongicola]MBN3561991.1 mandelate racemase/muconate lactonizing enzyme family protein [Aliamphritea spongicola]
MNNLVITHAEAFVTGPDVPRCRLAEDMGEVYETLTLLRLTTACGLEGFAGITTYSEHCFDESLGAALKPLLAGLPGKNVRDISAIWQYMMSRYNPMTPKPQSAIDIALWDLQAKSQNLPLYQLLGGSPANDSIPSYASTPLLDTPAEYVDFVRDLQTQGFDTVKFHLWCEPEKDMQLLKTIEEVFGNQLAFMIDLEERYSLEDALIISRQLEKMNCIWLEAPLPDTDLKGYAELRARTSVTVIPAGNTLLTPEMLSLAIDNHSWDSLRADVTYAGGFTGTRRLAELAAQHDMSIELQSWGYTATQAANLHLMLAISNTGYFEQPVPYSSHEAFCSTPIRTQSGRVKAPQGPGLGIKINWQQVAEQAFWHFETGSR